ncbi:MAG: hypothetical protein COA42_15300 [Alteromonadaceae bacterium]|nr:MAG: hypothetical protein COA42_15300 [Alteromonadaceae bacterium]
MACRFPGANNYQQYWQNLSQNKNCISQIPKDRWDWEAFFGDPKTSTNKTNIKWGGFIDDIDKFDPMFFNISPKEAACIDPQHRLFLQTAWHAIEDAGYSMESLSGKKIGVYAGVSKNDYAELMREMRQDIIPFISTGTVHSILANRLSFLFDFHGRSEAIDTACSSALVALHNAMRDINNGECESAVVGGVNALLAPTMYLSHSKSGMLSIDGQCKTFDADANGYVRAEGVGVLLIKSLDKALSDNDHIHAVVKGSAVNHGGRANFLTSPTVEAQAEVINMALANADVDPATVSYVEAHGTGTPLGDPIEISALKKAYASHAGKSPRALAKNTGYCALSSVKTNVGHLESASGVAGIIKAILSMQNKEIPALQNFQKINPYIELDDSPFYLADKNITWTPLLYADKVEVPRRVAVSSFGMGGVNAHVILEEAPLRDRAVNNSTQANNALETPLLFPISSKNKDFTTQVERLKSYLTDLAKPITYTHLRDIAFTLQVGREQFTQRLAILANNADELIAKINVHLDTKVDTKADTKATGVAGVYTGSVRLKKGERPEIIQAQAQMALSDLAERWVSGAKLDWSAYYPAQGSPLRVPLPTYVFANKRCWFSDDILSPKDSPKVAPKNTESTAVASSVVKADSNANTNVNTAPVINKNGVSMNTSVFTRTLSPTDFFIRDHVVQKVMLLPGVAYMELARLAYSQLVPLQTVNLIENVLWLSPVSVKDQDVRVEIKISPKKTKASQLSQQPKIRMAYQMSVSGAMHSKGELSCVEPSTLVADAIDIATFKSRCKHHITKADLYPLFSSSGLDYGESFQALQHCTYSDDAVFSELVIPPVVQAQFSDYVLHPSMMDGVFQSIVALTVLGQNITDRQYVPFSLDKVEILGPIPAHCYACATVQGGGRTASDEFKYDASICDENGKVFVKITGLSKRAISLHAKPPIITVTSNTVAPNTPATEKPISGALIEGNDIYYRPVWRPEALQGAVNDLNSVIVFGDKRDGAVLVDQIQRSTAANVPVVLVSMGEQFLVRSPVHIEINPLNYDDYLSLITYLKGEKISISGILYAWNFRTSESQDPTQIGVDSILRLTKAIIKKRAYKQVKLLYVYSSEEQARIPYHAMVGGFARTLVYENPKLRYYSVGVDRASENSLAALALNEFSSECRGKLHELFYQNNERFVRKVVNFDRQMTVNSNSPLLLKRNGVYVISGGAGGLGYIFAKHLSEVFKANVILIGRSAMKPALNEKVNTVNSLGGHCEYFSADIANYDAMSTVLAQIKSKYGHINGVIHGAGVIEDAYILLKQETSFNRVITTKTKGVINLDVLTADQNLDFFMMFSSIASLMPNQGQSDYASANSFLDYYGSYRNVLKASNERSGVSVTINWPLWANGGMGVTPEEEEHLLTVFGMKPLETAKGITILKQSLQFVDAFSQSKSLSQVFVIEGDKNKIASCLGMDSMDDNEYTGLEKNLFDTDRVEKNTTDRPTKNTGENTMKSEMMQIFSRRFDIAADRIDSSLNISEFGVDSITLLDIVSDVNKRYNSNIKPTIFFEVNSIDKFIEHVSKIVGTNPVEPVSEPQVIHARHNCSLIDVHASDPEKMIFKRTFHVTEFYLEDHVVEEQYNMPGACFIEMGRQVGDLLFGDRSTIKLINNYWVSQLSSPEADFDAYVNVYPKKDTFEYEIVSYSNTGDKNVHAIGHFVSDASQSTTRQTPPCDLQAIRSRCTAIQYSDEVYSQIIAEGLHVGPTFMPMSNIVLGESEALSSLALPESISDTVDDYVLHPTLLTGVFQTALICNRFDSPSTEYYIPINIDEIELFGRVGGECLIYCQPRKNNQKNAKLRKFDLCICNAEGEVAARLTGFSLRALKNKDKPYDSTRKMVTRHFSDTQSTKGNSHSSEAVQRLGAGYAGVANQTATANQNPVSQNPVASPVVVPTEVVIDSSQLTEATCTYLKDLLAEPLGLDASEIESDVSFESYGINSVMIVEINKTFENIFGSLSKTLFFEYDTVEEISEYFVESHEEKLKPLLGLSASASTTSNDSNQQVDTHHIVNKSQSAAPGNSPISSPIKNVVPAQIENSAQIESATHNYIKGLLADPVGLSEDEIDVDVSFDEYGINSVMIVELNKSFEDVFGSLSKTLFFEYSNIEELAEYFIESHQDKLHEVLGLAGASVAVHEEVVVQAQAAPQPQTAPPTPIGNLAVQEDSTNQLFDACCAHIKDLLSDPVGLSADEIDTDTSFEEYGINSVMIVELNKAFENIYGSLSKTLFFEYDNVEELAEYLIENHLSTLKTIVRIDATVDSASVPTTNKAPASNPAPAVPSSKASPAELQSIAPASQGGQAIASSDAVSEQKQATEAVSNDVAIIGVDGRYPGAKNVDQFWELLKNGDDAITEIPGSHFDYAPYFDADPEKDKIYSNKGGFIDDVDKFDASFFNISPREAELIDPQERLFLEVTWGALEDAGYTQKSLLDASDREVGVFVGALWQPYQAIGTEETMKGNTVAPSGLLYSIANRVSYYLNLSGPSLAIDTACSASLTAVHVACQSIASGDCKLAIAGGVNVSLHASKYLFLSQNRFLSTDGRCRSFGDGGDGYVPGEGVGAILLKPMAQAIKDGDNIYAVIKGSSVNHGGKTHGYTVPNPNAQAKLIQKVQKKSNIDPRTISYIEAHGTGTPLGDPIEITGLNKAFEASKNDKQFCAIGSVKSNIGHLEAAAGIAAITKVILQMKYKQLVPSIHSDTLNLNRSNNSESNITPLIKIARSVSP